MNKRIPTLDSFINESEGPQIYVDELKLIEVAKALALLDDYGITYWCKESNDIVFVVGDGSPFDMDLLISDFLPGIIRKGGYENEKFIKFAWDNEAGGPFDTGYEWYKFDKDKFKKIK